MQSNVARILKNIKAAEALTSDQFNDQRSAFKKQTTCLKKKMIWKRMAMALLVAISIAGLFIVVIFPLLRRS
jgi:Synaptobrevin